MKEKVSMDKIVEEWCKRNYSEEKIPEVYMIIASFLYDLDLGELDKIKEEIERKWGE